MRVRKLDADGDMQFGHGSLDIYKDSAEGVAQCVMTRLALWQETWFLDVDEGTPWLQDAIGKRMLVESVVKDRILGTDGVESIEDFEAILDPDTRRITITATINTIYGSTSVETSL